MAFPTGPVDNGTIYTDEYGNTFRYDVNVGSWEKFTTELGDPVYTTGATMEGDLVQSPSFDVRPQNPGELAINRVDDTKVQFKYMGRDFSTRGFDMNMTCVVDVTQQLLISSQALDGGSAVAQFGESLSVSQVARIAGFQGGYAWKWQRSDEIGSGENWSDIPNETSQSYTILETDRGKFLRLVQTFNGSTGLCGASSHEVVSNPVMVTFQVPIVDYFVFTHEDGSGKLHLELSQQTEVYKAQNDGSWELVENFAAGSRTFNLNPAQSGVYGVQSTGLTHFRFEDTNYLLEINIERSSKTPALTSLYRAFYDFGYFTQDVSFLNTSNVTNMDEMFALTQTYNAPVNFDVSNVTTAHRMFFDNRLFDNAPNNWYFPKLEQASNMFHNCLSLSSGSFKFSNKLVNASGMFRECKEFNGTVNMNAASNCTNVAYMFWNCSKFRGDSNMNNWNTAKWQNTYSMFTRCTSFNQNIRDWNLNEVTNSARMFQRSAYNQYFTNQWGLSKCQNMNAMFDLCSLRINVGGWNPSNCKDMGELFYANVLVEGLNNWRTKVDYVENMALMFSHYQSENYSLRGVDNWYTPRVNNLSGFARECKANLNLAYWCVANVPEAPDSFNENSAMGPGHVPKWGTCPPTFAYGNENKIKNQSRPNAASGEGRVGDVLRAEYSVSGASRVVHLWSRDGHGIPESQQSDPLGRTYTLFGMDVGTTISCYADAYNSNDEKSRKYLGTYKVAGYNSRAFEMNNYTVVTTNDEDSGLPVRVKLRFTGTLEVPYYKMDDKGEFQQVGEMTSGSDKILDLPTGIYQWEGTNMTVLDYSNSAEGSEYEEWSDAYKDAVL